jgi:N-acetyl-gamma-glutamyl-phosphate reductase
MQVIVPLHLSGLNLPKRRREIFERLREHYASSDRISVTDEIVGYAPSNLNAGSDKLLIRVAGSDDVVILTAQFDNLGKGAAGAAVQNMAIMLDIAEYGNYA